MERTPTEAGTKETRGQMLTPERGCYMGLRSVPRPPIGLYQDPKDYKNDLHKRIGDLDKRGHWFSSSGERKGDSHLSKRSATFERNLSYVQTPKVEVRGIGGWNHGGVTGANPNVVDPTHHKFWDKVVDGGHLIVNWCDRSRWTLVQLNRIPLKVCLGVSLCACVVCIWLWRLWTK